MNFPLRLLTAVAVTVLAIFSPSARALVSLEDGRDHVFVDASAEMSYDSNVFTNSQSGGSMVYEGTLSIEFVRRAGWIGVTGTVAVDYARYGNYSTQDYNDPKFSLELTKQTGRTTGSLTVDAQRENRADVTVNTRDVSWNYDVSLNFQYPVIQRYSINGSFAYTNAIYQDQQLFTNQATYTGSLFLYYVLNAQRDLFIDYRIRDTDEANGSFDIDNSLMGGVSGRVIGPFNGSVQVGYEERSPYGGAGDGQYQTVTANGSATWNINRRMTLNADLSRDYSTTATAQSVDITSAGLTYQDSMTSKASTTLEALVGENEFLGASGLISPDGQRRIDTFYSLSAQYFYTLNQHLKISISYTYYRSYSSLSIADFPRHEASLTLSSHW
ncbi:MAG: outer membrane beta-barrel protein [Opitutaceae bacterium]